MPALASRRTAARAVVGLVVAALALRHPAVALAAPVITALMDWWP